MLTSAVWSFMVCLSASNEEPSHVLRALGRSDAEAQSSLRITMGRHTTEEDVLAAIRTLTDLSVV